VLAAIVAAALPLAFGGAVTWARLAASAAVAAGALWVLAWNPSAAWRLGRVRWPCAALLGLAGLAALQALAGGSVTPRASLLAALQWAALAAALALGALAAGSRRGRRVLVGAFLLGALFQAFYGVVQWSAGAREIFGVPITSQPQRLKGAFVNPNHFALLAVVALVALQAWIAWGWRRWRDGDRHSEVLWLVVLPALVWLAILAALVFSGSRSGLVALVAGSATQALAWMSHVRRDAIPAGATRSRRSTLWRASVLFAVFAALGLVAVAALDWRRGTERLHARPWSDVSLGARLAAWSASLDLVAEAPLTGSGFGSFVDRFPSVADARFRGSVWEHAHNDWLELLVTGGLVGFALLVAGAASLTRTLDRVRRWGRRSEDRAAASFALGAVVAVACEEAFDFALLSHGNAFALALLLGAAAAATCESPAQRLETRIDAPR
jgi:O-antigen ligase